MKRSLIIMMILLSGCSAKQIHDGLQASQKQDCYSEPSSNQDACLERTNESYEEYSAKREEEMK